mmetsp:Transcript_131307/g.262020  ORF Transcript_131307/g.262020 Transcript_131307/m.262020 type:complete len:209 (+) Transcript_131307:78-704(+)|eukprot:CAMPEP_0172667262 /NCGR_PEP_ID=MMETSP1074-20121228/8309_1 /TAXON_ID=2916 /ORGANISM="Ceratium fusus, Strain PA161109" /LENGTH=208 /DNA_ID=CAMNT_0013483737 /DNA_START=15 /DNA_END=641 /DNA_ORIENTATION=-
MVLGSYKGGKSGKACKGSSSWAHREVHKPWMKQETARYSSYKGDKGGWGYGKGSYGYGKGDWGYKGYKGDYGFKGFGGKGKGKRIMRAPPVNSEFWSNKLGEENREELGNEVYSGIIHSYNWKLGWGFIMPDNPEDMPQQVKDRLKESMNSAKAEGKDWADMNLLYFRKPDVNHTEGFKLGKDVAVTFCAYVDDKGAGAYEVSMPEGE